MPDFLAEKAHIEKRCRIAAKEAIDAGVAVDGDAWLITSISRDACEIEIQTLTKQGIPGPHLKLGQPRDPRYQISIDLYGNRGTPGPYPMELAEPSVAPPSRTGWKRTLQQAVMWVVLEYI